jgi:hypothetical protein
VVLESMFVDEGLPDDPTDPRWDELEAVDFSLVGQVIAEPRQFTPAINLVSMKTMYNQDEIAFLIVWDDPTETIRAQPPGGKTGLPKQGEESLPQLLTDAIALEFPPEIHESGQRPHFLMGDQQTGAYLWYWRADVGSAQEMNSQGLQKMTRQNQERQQLSSMVQYNKGQWRLVIKRALKTPDEQDLSFEPGKFIPIAFFAWDGSNGDYSTKMSISSWYYLLLRPLRPVVLFVYPPLTVVIVIGLEFWVMKKIKRSRALS